MSELVSTFEVDDDRVSVELVELVREAVTTRIGAERVTT